MADEGLSLETLVEQYQRSLNGILVVAEKALPRRQAARLSAVLWRKLKLHKPRRALI
jgi:hypothetical protein